MAKARVQWLKQPKSKINHNCKVSKIVSHFRKAERKKALGAVCNNLGMLCKVLKPKKSAHFTKAQRKRGEVVVSKAQSCTHVLACIMSKNRESLEESTNDVSFIYICIYHALLFSVLFLG